MTLSRPGTRSLQRIAIFRALFLGDLLCAVPALRALRRGFQGAEITLIGLPWAEEFVERIPYVDRLLVFPGYPGISEVPVREDETARFLASARATGYDLAIQMHGDGSVSNGFVSDLGARLSLGFRRGDDDRLSLSLPYVAEEHEVRRWLRLVAELGIRPADTQIDFPITPRDGRRARQLLAATCQDRPLVGLHVGAKDPARRWPPDRFASLGDMLVERLGAEIVLTGSDSERPLTTAVRKTMRHTVHDLTGRTNLSELVAIVAGLDLLVTNDTGASHVAAATTTPSVILFGLSRPDGWAPLNRVRHRAVDALSFVPDDCDPAQALARLPIEPVYDACATLLAPGPRSRAVALGEAAGGVYETSPRGERRTYGTSLAEGDA